MNKKTRLVLLISIFTLLSLSAAAASSSKYVSISDIKKEAMNGWHQTYTYNGEDIKLDVEVEVPNVEKVPAVLVKWPTELTPKYAPPTAEISELYPHGFIYSVLSGPTTLTSVQSSGKDRYIENGARAENSPLTPNEALDFAQELLRPYVEDVGSFDLQLEYMDAWSRGYKAIDSTSAGPVLDYDEPTTEMGNYHIEFNQVFYGIPYTESRILFDDLSDRERTTPDGAMGEAYVIVGSKDDYVLAFAPAQVDHILTDDLPLAPFSEVKKEIEKLIKTGYIRDIYRLRLVYLRLYNPADIGNTWVLFPVWEVYGEIMRKPEDPTPVYDEADMEKARKFGGTSILINAQTGQAYNRKDNSSTRSDAVFQTWDEVK